MKYSMRNKLSKPDNLIKTPGIPDCFAYKRGCMIIGISGTSGAGKDLVAEYMKQMGFGYYSLSDILRDECAKRGIESNRDNLIAVGKELREKEGFGTLAKRALKKINQNRDKDAVIVSIRHPAEVEELRKDPFFRMIFIDAPIKLRYDRIKKRSGRPEDKVSFEKFEEQDLREHGTTGATQQLGNIKALADFVIINEGSIYDFEDKFTEIIRKL